MRRQVSWKWSRSRLERYFYSILFVTEVEFKKRRSTTGVGDGFLNHIGVAEDEEAPLGAGDCRVEELARGEGAIGFRG